MPTKPAVKPKKKILASQIVQRSITDFTKHPEHWVQDQWTENDTVELNYDQRDAIDDAYRDTKFPSVREPGNGMQSSKTLFEDLADVFFEPEQYCGLGGIRQSAYRMNKRAFWDWDFQKQLATAGAYLNAEAKRRVFSGETTIYEVAGQRKKQFTRPFDSFIQFNDHSETTLKDVIALFKVVLKQLKAKEAKEAEKAAAKLAAKA